MAWNVYGHDWAVAHLRKSMAHGRIRHAYLITGTESLGKNTLAHAFASLLNCTGEGERPCGECRSCRLIASGNHPDVVYSELDPNTSVLKIEEIRAVTQRIVLKPYESRYRIAILTDFDRARPTAQDALLKTLEEAPPHAVLILLAVSPEAVLPTILSRCQTLALRPVAADTIQSILVEHFGAETEQAALLGRVSGGRVGWAIRALSDPELLDQRTQALDALDAALKQNRAGRFDIAEDLSKDKNKLGLGRLLDLWQTYWRDVLLLTEGSPVKPCNTDRSVALEHLALNLTPEAALQALRATRTMLGYLPLNVNTRLALEVMFLDYPFVG